MRNPGFPESDMTSSNESGMCGDENEFRTKKVLAGSVRCAGFGEQHELANGVERVHVPDGIFELGGLRFWENAIGETEEFIFDLAISEWVAGIALGIIQLTAQGLSAGCDDFDDTALKS